MREHGHPPVLWSTCRKPGNLALETMNAGGAHWKKRASAGGSHDDGEDTSVTEIGGEVLVQASALQIERGEVLAGRYQIEAVLGRGGSGIVLRAFDRVARVAVAVKILKPELATDPRWIERFSRELRLGRQIQHPHVCRVFDIGQADGHWFITMELATGGTLRKQLGPDAAPRALEERLADVRAVVEGLAAIHEAGIVHRDVKPDNFLRMDDGRLVLSDFGLATNPADAPAVSIMVGTPHYMAPEVVMGEVATPRSDVWAAGVVVHEILCGDRPPRSFPGRRTHTPVSPVSSKARSPVLEACAAALAEDPDARPTSAVELRALVERAISSPSRFDARTRRRGRATLVWGGVAVATLGLSALFASRMWQRAQASSSGVAAIGEIKSVGTPRDWSVGAKTVATFGERVHCFDVLPSGEKARAIWGSPRRAEDIDLATGARSPSSIAAETYQAGCPALSPNGTSLLYARISTSSSPEIVRAGADGANAIAITSGSEPHWLPNGDEFVFQVDDAHAALFSIPTMKYSLVANTAVDHWRRLHLMTTSEKGDALAIVYQANELEQLLEIHSLPDLALVATWRLPSTVRGLTYFGGRLTLSNAAGPVLEQLDLLTGQSERVARLSNGTIQSVSQLPNGHRLLLSRSIRDDVWMFAPGEAPRSLTSDGMSFAPTWSSRGGVLFERELPDGKYAIFAIDEQGRTEQVTNGPFDGDPSFADGSNRWVYADYHRKAIVTCVKRTCSDLLRGDDLLDSPVMAPDEKHVAFVSLAGIPHVRVVDATGRLTRDLGPTATECAPVWTSASSLWAFSGAGALREWREFDVTSGTRTGRTKSATTFNADERRCGWENEQPSSPFYRRVRAVSREDWQVSRNEGGPSFGASN
jgi:Tol biopolymer transport system component